MTDKQDALVERIKANPILGAMMRALMTVDPDMAEPFKQAMDGELNPDPRMTLFLDALDAEWTTLQQPDERDAEVARAREQGHREGKAAVCHWLRHFTAVKPTPEGAERVAALADMFERSEQAYEALGAPK